MAVKANLVIDQGTDYSVSITVEDTTESVLDLTGYTGAAQMRKHYSSANATSFSVSLGGVHGTVALSMNSTTTTSLPPGRYVYDVELTDGSNNISRIIEGIITVTPNVTR